MFAINGVLFLRREERIFEGFCVGQEPTAAIGDEVGRIDDVILYKMSFTIEEGL